MTRAMKLSDRFLSTPTLTGLLITKRKHGAGLAAQRTAKFFQGFEIDSQRLLFFQSPESGVANAGLFCEPIKGSSALRQKFIKSDLNHGRRALLYSM